MASSFLRFLYHTQRRIIVGRTPLDEWSAPRRDLYLTTHNTHNRQTSMPPVGFEPTISAGERPQTYALDRAATGTGITQYTQYNFCDGRIYFYPYYNLKLYLLHCMGVRWRFTLQPILMLFHILIEIFSELQVTSPVSVATRSKAQVCGRSPAEIVGSNPTRGHVCLSVVSVVCCQVEVSATSWSLVHRSPVDCVASVCVI